MDKMSSQEFVKACIQLLIIISSCQFFGALFEKIKLPRLAGEIFSGFIFGPHVFSQIIPTFYQNVFNLKNNFVLSVFYWFGLLFLMLLSGLEIEKRMEPNGIKKIVLLLLGATLFPIIFSPLWLTNISWDSYSGITPPWAFKIIFVCAMCVTSIPVISRIFFDLGILGTAFAKSVLNVAVLQDSILWMAISIATAIAAQKHVDMFGLLGELVKSICFILVLPALTVRPLKKVFTYINPNSNHGQSWFFISYCLVMVVMAGLLDLNIIFAAFVAGLTLKNISNSQVGDFKKGLSTIAFSIFIPSYFFKVGQTLDFGHSFELSQFISFLVLSSLLKIIGVTICAIYLGMKFIEAVDFGVALNTRGSPGIVLATMALESAIISQQFFTTLVLVSISTSLFTGIWFRLKLERNLMSSDFLNQF